MSEIENRFWWYVARRNTVMRVLQHLGLTERGTALEIGCCTGGNLPHLSRAFSHVEALEPDREAIGLAVRKTRGTVAITEGFLPDGIPSRLRTPGVIFLLDVLEHIENGEASLRAVCGLLPPGGHLVLTTPAFRSLWSPNDDINHHYRRYTVPELTAMLKQAGFSRIVFSTYFNVFLAPAILLRHFIAKLRGTALDELAMPAAPINWLLTLIMGSESWLLTVFRFPFGRSALVVAQK